MDGYPEKRREKWKKPKYSSQITEIDILFLSKNSYLENDMYMSQSKRKAIMAISARQLLIRYQPAPLKTDQNTG